MNENTSGTIDVEIDGNKYSGKYSIIKGMLTVTAMYGSKTTHLGGITPEGLAKLMLSELVSEGKVTIS